MSATVSTANLRAELWYKELVADVQRITFMDKFMGEGPNNAIQVCRDLKKNPGDKMWIGLSARLSGDGISADTAMETAEEAISSYDFSLSISQLRNAVVLTGKMDEKKVAYDMRKDAKEKLKIWWAERIDKECIAKLCGDTDNKCGMTSSAFANTPTAPVSTEAVWAGGVSADGSLTSAMIMDTKVLHKAKQMALMHNPKIRPIRLEDTAYKGTDVYIAILHPYQADDLRRDPVWAQAQRDANIRGSDNPILSGALGIYNGIVVYQHENCYLHATGGSGAASIARGVLLGQQAAIFAEGRDAEWVEKSFDYGNQWGICAGRIFGVQKTKFNSKDYGLITMATAAAAASTA